MVVNKGILIFGGILFIMIVLIYFAATHSNLNIRKRRGDIVDSLNGVYVYYNGGVNQSSGRNTHDGYNIGIKYQCVEFVKRYYYEYYHHQMPDSYGHAKSYFNNSLLHGTLNKARGLIQYHNGTDVKPEIGDLVIFGPSLLNPYGHVAIVSDISDDFVEIIQQNYGPFGSPRERIPLLLRDSCWKIDNERVLGWLRKIVANENN